MKKINKKDIIYISLTIIVFLLIITIYYKNYLNTNISLFIKEIEIIEYLRTLYYSNFDLFPDFTFNLGNGQNIYYLSEYGLLSPITLVSYLLPFLSIKAYLSIISIISPIISTFLLYRLFRKKNYSSEICFLISLIFITSSTIVDTSFTSPLLSNYLIFLVLSYYGVDKVFNEKKGHLLTISVFLMIMTNHSQSISGIISILIYSLYTYLEHMNTITIKSLLKRIISIVVPIIVALLCSSILLLPTLITLSETPINQNTLSISINNFLYNRVGLGFTAILIPSIIAYIKKDKTNITLSILLIFLIIINILTNYPLISYLPLYLIIISSFLNNIINKKLNIKPLIIVSLIIISLLILLNFNKEILIIESLLIIAVISLYYKTSNKYILIIPISLFMLITQPFINNSKEETIITNQTSIIKLLNNIKDNNIYRTYIEEENQNNNYQKIDYYSSTLDINTQNNLYQELNQEILINNENQTNIISLLLNNNKYLISKNNPLHGYNQISRINEYKLYKNDNTFPIGFATSNVMSYEDFYKLNNQTKQEALLNVIVADTESKNDFVPTTKKIELPLKEIFNQDNLYSENNQVFINTKEILKINYTLPEKYQNKILFIKFNVKNSRDNQIVKINNISKTISKSNHSLEYILSSSNQSNLIFTFTKGQYLLSDFEFYILDYANIENCSKKVDPFIIESNNTKGDKIIGTIEVSQDSYFMITLPYEKGFTILVDNNKIAYEKVDETYIGFQISEGLHSIEIRYTVPYKYLAYLLTILGIISFITITYFESKRQFN